MPITFTQPEVSVESAYHHAAAASQNDAVAEEAAEQLHDCLSTVSDIKRILLKAAAGAGKSYALKRLVAEATEHQGCLRVAVIAFQNRQLWPLASELGEALGRDKVCLFSSKAAYDDVPADVHRFAHVVTSAPSIPQDCSVVISTSHRLGAIGEKARLEEHLGLGVNGETPFDVLFVDEAWQLAHHLFDKVEGIAPIVVGVGDVGQRPPIEIGSNPWRGDPGYNPYRAWPNDYVDDPETWAAELPAVWRPTAEQLPLWRAFYPEWGELNCVAAPGDRSIALNDMPESAAAIWEQVATGDPVLLEVDGLAPAEAADVDLPLMEFVEDLLDELLTAGFALNKAEYDPNGAPNGLQERQQPGDDGQDQLIAILATRNQAVDDAADAAERLRDKHGLSENDIRSSTVDSWQGQTNGITVAVHPLTGASQLDEFNSAFGRLAVTCTRATHGLLVVSRPGLDELLADAPARPGTPFGEPGNRHLPRQTHQRILATFARGRLTLSPSTL